MAVHGIAIYEPPALDEVCACHAVGEVYDEQFDVNIRAGWCVEVWERILFNVVNVELEIGRRVFESGLCLVVNWVVCEVNPSVPDEEWGIGWEGCCARCDVGV